MYRAVQRAIEIGSSVHDRRRDWRLGSEGNGVGLGGIKVGPLYRVANVDANRSPEETHYRLVLASSCGGHDLANARDHRMARRIVALLWRTLVIRKNVAGLIGAQLVVKALVMRQVRAERQNVNGAVHIRMHQAHQLELARN